LQKYALYRALEAVRHTTVIGMGQSSSHHTPARHEIVEELSVAPQCLHTSY
jgi:hypothetical protein